MWFWWFMLACDLIVPGIMVLAGWMMWKHCPQDINVAYGYRTLRSMRNMDTWKFAHAHCGRLWWKLGLALVIPSILIHIPFFKSGKELVSAVSMIIMAVQTAILVASIFPTEAALKRTFNDDGTRR